MKKIDGIIIREPRTDVDKIRRKLDAFMGLLTKNDIALQVIAELEDKARGDDPFEMAYLRMNVDALFSTVSNAIDDLDVISGNTFRGLEEKFNDITDLISVELAKKKEIPEDSICIPLSEIDHTRLESVGGKNAHLGELNNVLDMPVPDGFGVSAWAYKLFMEHKNFHDEIKIRLDAVDVHDLKSTGKLSMEIQERILSRPLLPEIEEAINDQCRRLAENGIDRVSVRSSAIDESTKFSFAGQYATFLNVPLDEVPKRYKEVVASKFSPMALFYLINKGFIEEEIAMSVCCMAMVDATSSGVMQTTNPLDPTGSKCVINSLWGLGLDVVLGTVPPDLFIIRKRDDAIIESKIAHKNLMAIMNEAGGVEEIEVEPDKRDKASISDAIIRELVDMAHKLEEHYGCPQDVEWAVDKSGKIYLLQSRQIRLSQDEGKASPVEDQKAPVVTDHEILLEGGEVAYRGVAYGSVFVLEHERDLAKVPNGCILVARRATPSIVSVMTRTKGIITSVGSPTGHMATLAREFMIPTLVNVRDAEKALESKKHVTLDSANGIVYEGRVNELLTYEARARRGFFSETPVYDVLKRTLGHIAPLNLVDPESPHFTPDNCKTIHDVVRFSHQKAMACMLTLAEDAARTAKIGTRLKAEIPLDVYILDLGGGICDTRSSETILPEDICSAPMCAFWKGLTDVKWPGPTPVMQTDPNSVVGGTIADPKLKQRLKEKTLAIITKSYMNFSLHLGYHLATVEGLASPNPRDSYARLYFQGGGATSERRVRRASLVSRILEYYGFEVYMQVDLINAIYSICTKEELENIMRMLGHLTVYTKQLDMVMFNDDIVDWFVEEFLKENYN